MERPRFITGLRIATSAVCLIACALLIALWVRSYVYADLVMVRLTSTSRLYFQSSRGELRLPLKGSDHNELFDLPWRFSSTSVKRIDEVEELLNKASGASKPVTRIAPRFGVMNDSLVMPHWFPILVSGVSAAILGIARPFRFTLRTLLIATTLVAVVLWLIVAMSR
jgi:hypothetical protein